MYGEFELSHRAAEPQRRGRIVVVNSSGDGVMSLVKDEYQFAQKSRSSLKK